MKLLLKIILLILLIARVSLSEEVQLSLNRALELAAENDLLLATARLDIEAGDASVREAISAALPKISAGTTVMRHMIIPKFFLFGEWYPTGQPSDITADVTLQQPIWLAGKVGIALKAARLYQQIARDALNSSRARIKSDLIKEYFGLVLAREVVSVMRESHTQAAKHAETVERMYNVGMASEFDLLRAKVEVKSLEPEVEASAKRVELARISLGNRLGVDPASELILTDDLTSDLRSINALPYDDALNAALGIRPEFKLFNRREKLDKISLKAENRNLYWPNLFFGLNYRMYSQEISFLDMSGDRWIDSFTWTLNLQIPLFDGFATPAKVQKAKIGLRRTVFERMQLEQGVRLEVSYALSELKRAADQLSSLEATLELAEKSSDIAQTRFAEGISTELELLDARLTLHRSRLAHLQGLYDLRIAKAEYARIVENDTDFGGGNQ